MVNAALDLEESLAEVENEEQRYEQLRRTKRIRSISWAPNESISNSNVNLSLFDSLNIRNQQFQYLAITNDADEILILKILSPWLHRQSPSWKADIISRVGWKTIKPSPIRPERDDSVQTSSQGLISSWTSLFQESLRLKCCIDSVFWSPWRNSGSEISLILRRKSQIAEMNFQKEALRGDLRCSSSAKLISRGNEEETTKSPYPRTCGAISVQRTQLLWLLDRYLC